MVFEIFFSLLATPSCKNVKCGRNEVCAQCGPNICNTYNCNNPDGSKIKCKVDCTNKRPSCICKPFFHRLSTNGPCVRLKC